MFSLVKYSFATGRLFLKRLQKLKEEKLFFFMKSFLAFSVDLRLASPRFTRTICQRNFSIYRINGQRRGRQRRRARTVVKSSPPPVVINR